MAPCSAFDPTAPDAHLLLLDMVEKPTTRTESTGRLGALSQWQSRSQHRQEGGITSTAIASKRRLEQLIEEAIVDCYGEEEQATGLFTMIEGNLALPFRTTILGVTVDVVGVDMSDDGTVIAICKAGKHRQRIALADLPLPSPPPAGAEWIAAYRHWAKHQG